MALSQTTLSNELYNRVFNSKSADPIPAAGWAAAYSAFAATAQGCGTPVLPASLVTGEALLKAALVSSFIGQDPATTALAMQTAFMSFWTGFAFSGTVVATPGTPTLGSLLAAQWAANPLVSDPMQASNLHAATLYAWSLTVVTALPCFAPIV